MTTISNINGIAYSGDLRADSLLGPIVANWNYLLPTRSTLYYTFDCSPGSAIDQASSEALSAFNGSQQSAATSILAYVASLTGLSFVQTSSGASADFHFGAINISGATTSGLCKSTSSYSYTAGEVLTQYSAESYIYLDNVEFASSNNSLSPGASGYETLLHEIGHALGLDHPFDGAYPLSPAQDNTNNTVMSYTHAGAFKSVFQSYDLLALTWIYGKDGLRGSYGFNSVQGPSLTPGVAADTTAPAVITFSPADEATGVAINSNIVVAFSEAITRGVGSIVLKTAAGSTVATYAAASSANLSISGNTLTINPTANLADGAGYTVEFAYGSVKDLAGNNYAGTSQYNFTTVAPLDTTAPAVITFSPADEATGVAINSNIVVAFSEAISRGVGSIVLKTAAGSTVATYAAASSANLSISGNTLTINPTANLAYGAGYTVEFAYGSVKDLAGNNYAGTTSYNFTVAPLPGQTFIGTSANEWFSGGAGDDIVDGGAGSDTVVYSGNRSNYEVIKTASGYTVSSGSDGTDTLTHIELLQFADKPLNFEQFDQLNKYYVAYYGRPAASSGIDYWLTALNTQMSDDESQLVWNFGNSQQPEFVKLYGSASTTQDFVSSVFDNLFNRAPAQAGLDYWQGIYNNFQNQGLDDSAIRGKMVAWIMGGATDSSGYLDLSALNNKVIAATAFTAAIDTSEELIGYQRVSNTAALDYARDWLHSVTSEPSSLSTQLDTAALDQSIIELVGLYIVG